jgi:hypothetical protein
MANDLDRHLQVQNIKYQTQFDKLSAIARKCAENTLAYHLEDKFTKPPNGFSNFSLWLLTASVLWVVSPLSVSQL